MVSSFAAIRAVLSAVPPPVPPCVPPLSERVPPGVLSASSSTNTLPSSSRSVGNVPRFTRWRVASVEMPSTVAASVTGRRILLPVPPGIPSCVPPCDIPGSVGYIPAPVQDNSLETLHLVGRLLHSGHFQCVGGIGE